MVQLTSHQSPVCSPVLTSPGAQGQAARPSVLSASSTVAANSWWPTYKEYGPYRLFYLRSLSNRSPLHQDMPCPALPCPAVPCRALPCPDQHNFVVSRSPTCPGTRGTAYIGSPRYAARRAFGNVPIPISSIRYCHCYLELFFARWVIETDDHSV